MEPKLIFSNESECDKFKFRCKNGECVDSKLLCDGRPAQCQDGSDLEYCAENFSCVQPKYKQCPKVWFKNKNWHMQLFLTNMKPVTN